MAMWTLSPLFSLAFDLDLQTCDWSSNVQNCDRLSKPRNPKPDFDTPEPVCPDGQLQCRSGECLDKSAFCDKVRSMNGSSVSLSLTHSLPLPL